MKFLSFATVLAVLLVLQPQEAASQGDPTQYSDFGSASTPAVPQALERDGLWLGGGLGVGYATIDCVRCGDLFEDDPWEGGLGVAAFFGIGRALTSRIQAGAEISLWARRSGSLSRDATLATIGVGGRFYPIPLGNLYLTADVGLGGSILAGDGLIESPGFGAGIGAGYDIAVGGNTALSPFARFFQIVGEGATGRNQGESAVGPDSPRFFQFGIAFMRY